MAAPGLEEIETLRKAGFSEQEIQQHKSEVAEQLKSAGFTYPEIDAHFGIVEPDISATKTALQENLKAYKATGTPAPSGTPVQAGAPEIPINPELRAADSMIEAFEAGWQTSISGLVKRGKLPDTMLAEDADIFDKLAMASGQMLGDVPAMIPGAVAGAEIGATTGAVVGGLAGAPIAGVGAIPGMALGGFVGATVGGGAGAFAAPSMMRKALMDHYEKGDIKDPADFLVRTNAVLLEGAKGAAIGGVTAIAGPAAGIAAKGAAPIVSKSAALSAELATMTAVTSAVEKELPRFDDFAVNAILLGGMHGTVATAGKLRNIYRETGVKPEMVTEIAMQDPVMLGELLSDRGKFEVPTEFKPLKQGEGPKMVRVEIPGDKTGEFVFRTIEQVKKAEEATPPKAEKPATPPADDPVSQAREKIRSKVASAPEHKNEPYDVDRFIEDMIDFRQPLKKLDEAFNGGEKLSPEKIETSTYALSRMFSGLPGKLDAWMKYGPIDFKTGNRTGTRGLGTILQEMGPELRAQGRDYAISMRVVELDRRGIKHPFDSAAAKVIAQSTSKEVKAYHQEILTFRNEQTKYLVDSGLMDKKTAEKMFKESVDYTPFYRLQEEAPSAGAGEMRSSKNPIKRMNGSEDGVVLDPYESLIRDLGVMVKMAEKNKVLKSIGEQAAKNPEIAKEIGIEKVEIKQKAITVTDKEVARWMEENNIQGDAAEMMIFRKADKALAENEIAFYDNGKRQVYKVPPAVKRALDNMDPQESNVFIKVLGSTTKALKMGVTMTPEFALRNPIRDNISAIVVSRNGYNPFHFVRGALALCKNSEVAQRWLYEGGGNATFNTFDSKSLLVDFTQLDKQTGFISNGWNVIKKPAEAMHATAQLLENSTRVGEFIAAKEKGRSNMSAAYESRDLIDFHRVGAKGRALNQIISFWNANVQGKNRLYTAFKEDPQGTTARIVKTTVIPTVALWWAQKDDPRINEAPNFIRDNHFLIGTDKWVDVDPNNPPPIGSYTRELNGKLQVNEGIVFKIPMSQDVAPIGALTWRTLDSYYKEDPTAFEDFGKTLGGAAGLDFMPNAFLPVVEHITNHSMFTDRPLVSPGMEKVLPHLRYNAYSSETAKQLSRLIGRMPGGNSMELSPPVLENYIRQWSGTWGMYAVQAADKALISSGAVPDPVKPTPTWSDTPFFKAFVVRYPSASAQSIQDFRAEYQRTSQVLESIKLQISRGEINDAVSMQNAALAEGQMIRLQGVQESLNNQVRMAQSISDNKALTPDDKRQLLDSIYYGMMATAQGANKALAEAKKALKK